VATDELTLEEGKAKYEPKEVDIASASMTPSSKAWSRGPGTACSPSNKLLKPGGTLIVTSLKEADQLIPLAHRKETPYKLAVLKGTPSFSGLWSTRTITPTFASSARWPGASRAVQPRSVQETISR